MHMKPAEYAIHAFQGVRSLARALGRDPDQISRWKRPKTSNGCSGGIPKSAMKPILEAARCKGIDITAEDLLFGRTIKTDTESG